jgi:hypothetical protein
VCHICIHCLVPLCDHFKCDPLYVTTSMWPPLCDHFCHPWTTQISCTSLGSLTQTSRTRSMIGSLTQTSRTGFFSYTHNTHTYTAQHTQHTTHNTHTHTYTAQHTQHTHTTHTVLDDCVRESPSHTHTQHTRWSHTTFRTSPVVLN